MINYKLLFSTFTLLFSLLASANIRIYTITGEIEISTSRESFYARYDIAGFQDGEKPIFILNNELDLVEIRLNGLSVESRIVSTKSCIQCTEYKIRRASLSKDDVVEIVVELKKKNTSEIYDNKKAMAFNNNIFRASEDSNWFPRVLAKEGVDHYYNYDLKISDDEDSNIYIDGNSPYASPAHFISDKPQKPVLLISGSFSYYLLEDYLVLNLEENQKGKLFQKTQDILGYYSSLLEIDRDDKFNFLFLASDNPNWSGFVSGQSIVFLTRKDFNSTLAHELAHYYVPHIMSSTSYFYWLILESIPEYLTLKYSLDDHNSDHIKGRFRALSRTTQRKGVFNKLFKSRKETEFVRLDKVRKRSDISPHSRYNVIPFQLMAIENLIGEAKMINFVRAISSQEYEVGYSSFLLALKESGVSGRDIQTIEDRIIKKFDPAEYNFIAEYIALR